MKTTILFLLLSVLCQAQMPVVQHIPYQKASCPDCDADEVLHFNGTNGSTTITSESALYTWTANGNAQLSTSSPKFGTAAALFDGSGDYISTPNHADFRPSGSYALSMWVKVSSDANFHLLFQSAGVSGATTNGIAVFLNSGAGFRVWHYGTGSGDIRIQNTTTTIKNGSWHHLEVNYNSGTGMMYLFIDGVAAASGGQANAAFNANNVVRLGWFGHGAGEDYYLNGQIDEFKWQNGSYWHTSGFTAPSRECCVYF